MCPGAPFIQSQYKEQFVQFAHIFCMTMDNWLSYQYIKGIAESNETFYCNDRWSILRVLFTDMGEPEFQQLGVVDQFEFLIFYKSLNQKKSLLFQYQPTNRFLRKNSPHVLNHLLSGKAVYYRL
jgi:hypothetical protein